MKERRDALVCCFSRRIEKEKERSGRGKEGNGGKGCDKDTFMLVFSRRMEREKVKQKSKIRGAIETVLHALRVKMEREIQWNRESKEVCKEKREKRGAMETRLCWFSHRMEREKEKKRKRKSKGCDKDSVIRVAS